MIQFTTNLPIAAAALLLATTVTSWSQTTGGATSPTIVQGRWGALVDGDPPPKLETERDRIEHYRRQQMRAISAHYRSIEAIVTYRAPILPRLGPEAQLLANAASALPTLFPEGSEMRARGAGASPRIWQEFPRFIQHVTSFAEATQGLARATREPQRLAAALAAVRHECLACHQAFRVRAPIQ